MARGTQTGATSRPCHLAWDCGGGRDGSHEEIAIGPIAGDIDRLADLVDDPPAAGG